MDSVQPRETDGPSPSSTSTNSSLWPPTKRRRAAPVVTDCCRTCRLRKVKCTGNVGKGPCTNCSRLELTCSFVDPESKPELSVSRTTPSHSHTEAGTLRKRAQRACSQCHAHKTKCSGDLPRCKRCEASNLACEYTPAKRKFTNVRFHSPTGMEKTHSLSSLPATAQNSDGTLSPPAGSTVESGSLMTTSFGNFPLTIDSSSFNTEELLFRKNLILQHMDAYMDHLYYLPSHGFLHPETTYQRIHDGTFDPALAAALCSIVSVLVNPGEGGREFGQKCNEQVELYIFQNLKLFSEDLLPLFALNIGFNLLNGSFAKVWQCFGVATRLMLGLQVNWDVTPRDRSFIQQESLRRVTWQVFVIDRLLAGGYEEYISCRSENMKIRLPCDEKAFRENRSVVPERLHESPGRNLNTGLHGYLIRLIDVRHRIQVSTRKLISPSGFSRSALEPSQVMADIVNLQNELARFHASAPDDIRLSDHSISRYMASQERSGYVFFHTHLSVCHTDLYRFSLPGQREAASIEVLRKLPRDFVLRSQRQAVAHSMCLGRFAEAIQNEVDQQPYTGKLKIAGDYTIFHLAIQCVEVLLIALKHNLYQDLENDTTAPLWRSGPRDEAHVRGLIDSLHRVAEPWCQIFDIAQKSYDASIALVEEFDRSRHAADQRSPTRYADTAGSGSSQLPGPDFMLDGIPGAPEEENGTSRSCDPTTPGPWFPVSQGSTGAHRPFSASDVGTDMEFGPPGLPLLLAHARGAGNAAMDISMGYDEGNAGMDIGHLNGMMPGSQGVIQQATGGMPVAPLNGAPNSSMLQHLPQNQVAPLPQHVDFLPPQQDMFMVGHPGPYTDGRSDQASYLPQTTF